MKLIKSPLNYVGGKFKLLPQILPLFPDNIDTFVDLFGGGFNVGINVTANKIIYNDTCKQVVDMLEYFNRYIVDFLLCTIEGLIREYNLSKTNQEGYLQIREHYNKRGDRLPTYLYTLICYAFNNQIRFNNKGEYNMPFGKDRSSFNPALKQKFIDFVDRLHKINVAFTNNDFRELDISKLTTNDMVYVDPPYLNTTATYNESNGWTQRDECELLLLLARMSTNRINWALSNNLSVNPELEVWANEHEYYIHELSISYSNSNYQKKDKSADREVLITNY